MKKRQSLKKVLLTEVIAFVAVIILIITIINVRMQTTRITELTEAVLAGESVSYASEVYNWWSSIENRVAQTARVIQNTPEMSYDDALNMLLQLTANDPDSQDIYMAYGDTGKFLDGSGWIPDDSFVFTDRAWYTGAIEKNGEIYSSEPYVDASTGKTCLACSIMIRDGVVLSSDINFDKVTEKLTTFRSSSSDAKFYIINKQTKDILVSNVDGVTGEKVDACADPIMKGLNEVFGSLKTVSTDDADKVVITKTEAGKMMYTATDIRDTSWIVVSAVPYSFISDNVGKTTAVTFVVAMTLLLLLAALLFYIINKFINPVTKVTERINDISRGDFTVNIVPEGNNEITTLSERVNEYIESMREMLLGVAGISKDMHSSAGECMNITSTLSASNQSQGESIEKLNRTLTNMNESIDEIAKAATDLAQTSNALSMNAEEVKNLCVETMDSSTSGRDEMADMTRKVKTLNTMMGELTDIIRTTARSVEEITGITATINEISEQTNLLSLNASIEAARAGEQGKGFAVVASEVGMLAKQSSEATESIRKLINEITQNIEDINRKADACMVDMDACMQGVDSANNSFDIICDDITKATDGIIEITNSIVRINDVASGNAATTEEQAAAISEILVLSDMIVEESNKILSETESINDISRNLNHYSDSIQEDLGKYTL